MHHTARRLLWGLLIAFLLYVAVFTVAMVSQLADAADRLHAGSGQWAFWCLIVMLVAAIGLPTVWMLRLPAALKPPADSSPEALATYHTQLLQHLQRHPLLQEQAVKHIDDIAPALAHLRTLAEAEIRMQAGSVLVSTALLQNGKLDALVVLATQIRLVWRLSHLYGLRPTLSQIGYVYGNVGACMLLATAIDDVDFAEMTAPLVQASTPAALASIPGLGTIGALLTNSLASGAANAFLTLRVGLIAQAYCAPEQLPQRTLVRRNATVRAASLLGQIVRDAGSQVSQAVYGRMKQAVQDGVQNSTQTVKKAGTQMADAARNATRSTSELLDHAAEKVETATLSVADSTARAANTVQRHSVQASQHTRNWLHRAIVTLKGAPKN